MIKDVSGNNRFYGIYRGITVDVRDPLGKNRITLKVPQVLSDQITGWAWPVVPAGGSLSLPAVNDGVFVMFEGGDPSFPLWVGTFK